MLAIMYKKKPIHRPKQINLLSGNNEIYHVHRFLFPYLMGRHYTLHISQSLWYENRLTCTPSNEGMWAINFSNKGLMQIQALFKEVGPIEWTIDGKC